MQSSTAPPLLPVELTGLDRAAGAAGEPCLSGECLDVALGLVLDGHCDGTGADGLARSRWDTLLAQDSVGVIA